MYSSKLVMANVLVAAVAASPLPPLRLSDFAPELQPRVRAIYERARTNPKDGSAVGKLGMMFHAYLRFESAAACYRMARTLQPAGDRWSYYLAIVASELGRDEQSAAAMAEFLKKRPDYIPALLRQAESLFKLGRLDESARLYETLRQHESASAAAHYGLGRISAARNNNYDAVFHLQRAIEIFPAFGAAHYSLGMAYRNLKETGKARQQLALYEKFRLVWPPLSDPYFDAVENLNQSAQFHIKKAAGLQSAGQLAAAAAEHQKALQIDPRSTQAHANLISIFGELGDVDKAEKHYRTLLEINPNLAESHYNFGVLMASRQRSSEAAEAFRKTLQINPDHPEAHNNYAFLLMTEGKLEEAEGHYRAALQNKPGYRLAHFNLGKILVASGRVSEAIEHFLQTLEPDDDSTPHYMYALGAAYARIGDREKALRFIRDARTRAAALGQQELLHSMERDLRALEGP